MGYQAKQDELGRVCNMHMRDEKHKILVQKPAGKRPLRRLRCKWEDNIRKDFRVTGWVGVGWMYLT
jgi:hypothetical protein